MRLFSDITGKGTFARADRAERKITDLSAKMNVDFRYVIISTPDGRYMPCVILLPEQQHYAGGSPIRAFASHSDHGETQDQA